MAYIVNRNDHFYVVAYDGVDPITGRERRRWHPAGRSHADAETIAASLTVRSALTAPGTSITTRDFLAEQWMPRRSALLRPTTAHRYAWMVEHYICPRIGAVPLRRLRVDHLDELYADLLTRGGHTGAALAPKTVYDVHVIVRSALADATRRQLIGVNVALLAQAPRSQPRSVGAGRGPRTRIDSGCSGRLGTAPVGSARSNATSPDTRVATKPGARWSKRAAPVGRSATSSRGSTVSSAKSITFMSAFIPGAIAPLSSRP